MWRGNPASSVVGLQRPCMLPLRLLKPCHHHMNKPRPACWRMRQHEEEVPDTPAENTSGQSTFSQSFKTWEGLEPHSYSAANHRCMDTMEARQRTHPHYLKMHGWEVMLIVSNPWLSGDISTVFPDSNLTCLVLATRIVSSKHKLDHNMLLNIQQWFRCQFLYRARVLKKGLSWPAHCLPPQRLNQEASSEATQLLGAALHQAPLPSAESLSCSEAWSLGSWRFLSDCP